MFKILRKEEWSPNVYAMDIEAPRVAKKAQAGQFIVLRVNEEGERIPLTIADYDRETGKILIVFQAIGASTMELAALEAGDTILDFVGPLGRPSEIAKLDGTMVVVGGGIGNMIDRLWHGYVTDMICFDFIDFPIFNVADCFITCGCIALMIYIIFFDREKKPKTDKPAEAE